MTTPHEKRPSRFFTEYYSTAFFVLVLAFLAAAIFVLKPKLDAVKQTNAEIEKTILQLENERAYLGSLEQSIVAAQTIAPSVLDRVGQALPSEPNIPELLVLFSSIAERDGVKIANITFADIRPTAAPRGRASTSTVSEIQITLSVAAENYPQIKRFLRSIERSLRIVDIQGINVTSGGDESLYAIQAKTYIYRR